MSYTKQRLYDVSQRTVGANSDVGLTHQIYIKDQVSDERLHVQRVTDLDWESLYSLHKLTKDVNQSPPIIQMLIR